ncbi:MAG: hypothetical protein LKI93_04810 [Bifidobacteriaceae bacterium]|jgi:hypothetical protein|nr:hypothetical protein [Bifidobacteriaceae bacterium]
MADDERDSGPERSQNENAAHDDSGTGRKQTTGAGSSGVARESQQEPSAADSKQGRNLDTRGDAEANKDSALEGEITEGSGSEKVNAVLELLAGASESYSGMLPRPEDFKKYPKEVQERMCRWNDAFTIDESRRQDSLVENEISQSHTSMWITSVLFLVTLVLSFIAFLVTSSPWSFGFLAVPVVSMIVNLAQPVFSKSSREGRKDKEVSTVRTAGEDTSDGGN